MKRILTLLLCLCLFSPSLAEDAFNTEVLRQDGNIYSFTQHGTANTVFRFVNQPYFGQTDEAFEGSLIAFVDYLSLPDYDATLLRLMISIETYTPIWADEMRLTVGGKQYTFAVSCEQSEYDGLYMEDYAVCLTDASLPLLKAIAQQKQDDPIPVELFYLGEMLFSGMVTIPGEEAAMLYDQFVDLGGKRQPLKKLDEVWPCQVEKLK